VPPDVSVIMPACRARGTIARAARSAIAQRGVNVELIVCADDGEDYGDLLRQEVPASAALTLCRTAAPYRGPSAARNVALGHARADVIACLDADDCFAPARLRLLLPLVEAHGVATGATWEIDPRSGVTRIARPRRARDRLEIEDICELRMPFPPVFHRRCGVSWPEIAFAEDVILNVALFCACRRYPFVARARYHYYLGPDTRSHSALALAQARAGYLQILHTIGERNWPDPVREVVARAFREDLHNVDQAQAADGADRSWREVVRAPTRP
jgi:glycosyltransferase involved in cell wall biosynthesis